MSNALKLVQAKVSVDHNRNVIDLYGCICGNLFKTRRASVRSGHTKSCGCLRDSSTSERFRTHGRSRTSEFYTWQALIQRCTNVNDSGWKHYGGRGITVCSEWLNSFETFLSDMGPRPPGLSLDRIDNDKGYSKDNCRWATIEVQNNNKRQRGAKRERIR